MKKIALHLFTLIYTPISLLVLILSFFILTVPISLVALCFPKQSTRLKITERFWGLFGTIIIKIVCLIHYYKVDERDEFSKSTGIPKGLYIANHSSYLDIPALLTTIRVPPVMKKEVLYIPIFGLLGYASGAVVINRSNQKSRQAVIETARKRLLGDDGCMQYYPEGTRQKTAKGPKEFREIKTKLMSLAYELNIPIYPVSIYGTNNILTSWGTCQFFKPVGVKFHAGLHPKDFESEAEFLKMSWEKIQRGYQELEKHFLANSKFSNSK